MAKPKVVTDLQIWMLQTDRSDVKLAGEINKLLAGTREINERHVSRWRKGLALPRYPEIYKALETITGGEITANSFMNPKLGGPNNGNSS
jgi:hypothetical protein